MMRLTEHSLRVVQLSPPSCPTRAALEDETEEVCLTAPTERSLDALSVLDVSAVLETLEAIEHSLQQPEQRETRARDDEVTRKVWVPRA